MLTYMIEAYEGRSVAMADVSRVYLNALIDEFIVLKMIGK